MSIRSRGGNFVLAAIGAVYVFAALFALTAVIREAIAAGQLMDAELQFLLVAAAACGVWFILIALENLGWRRGTRASVLRPAPVHRTDAVAPR